MPQIGVQVLGEPVPLAEGPCLVVVVVHEALVVHGDSDSKDDVVVGVRDKIVLFERLLVPFER